jgi:uncharacterized membrane protein
MPVILTTPEEIETWLTAPTPEALKLQRPLPDGVLRVVARGEKKDGALAEVYLPDHVDETIRSMARLHSEHQESATFQQRAVGHITAFLGHPSVAGGLAVTIACWVGANLFAASLGYRVPDPPPFQWLQDAMTLISLFMVFLILGAQKHEDALNKHRELLTLELAVLSEQKTAKVIQLLEEFRRDSPEIHDRVDHEADKLAQPANPRSVLDAIKDTRRPAP